MEKKKKKKEGGGDFVKAWKFSIIVVTKSLLKLKLLEKS